MNPVGLDNLAMVQFSCRVGCAGAMCEPSGPRNFGDGPVLMQGLPSRSFIGDLQGPYSCLIGALEEHYKNFIGAL